MINSACTPQARRQPRVVAPPAYRPSGGLCGRRDLPSAAFRLAGAAPLQGWRGTRGVDLFGAVTMMTHGARRPKGGALLNVQDQ